MADFKHFEKFGIMRFHIEKSYTPYPYWVYDLFGFLLWKKLSGKMSFCTSGKIHFLIRTRVIRL